VTVHNNQNALHNKDWFWMALLGLTIIIFCQRILFTDQIIRASDVITQYFWAAKGISDQSLFEYIQTLPGIFQANWEPLNDGGRTLEGGWNAIGLLFHRYLIQHFFPFPASIAWLVVLSLIWGGIGTFRFSRNIGIGQKGAFLAGIIFALCAENTTLINAGHIQKLEAICWFPWIMLFMEKALSSGRFFYYAMTSLMLSIQFFHMHWQISFYSCLAVGAYWLWYMAGRFGKPDTEFARPITKEILMAVVLVVLFFSTIAMSFAPLVSWSQQSERGEAIGSSTTKPAESGIGFDEGMSWSMPPEEILTYVIPGLFGYSRQEEGDVPASGQVYYWGRMRFTQTSDYLGLLPWLLIPLPLLFRKDRHTFFLTFLMAATLIMALGKYTFVYRFMFDHLPAFSSFRVPKMILFLFAFGAAVLAGRGLDVLSEKAIERQQLVKWAWWCVGVTAFIGLTSILIFVSEQPIITAMKEYIAAPTRYQNHPQLFWERFIHMFRDGVISFGVAALYLTAVIAWFKHWLPDRLLFPVLIILMLSDLWRVNNRFLVVTPAPESRREIARNDIVNFLKPRIEHYRMQPLNGENAHYYADNELPNISAYVTISERRYKQFLDTISLTSPMPDIMNMKYLLMTSSDFEAQKQELAQKYYPVFTSTNGSVVLENKTVLPKAWLVPSAAVITAPEQRLAIMANSPEFKADRIALVESAPSLQLLPYPYNSSVRIGKADVVAYEPNRIIVEAQTNQNNLLIIGEKYYRWWYATVNGNKTEIVPVNHILRGVYLPPGKHTVEFVFDPLPFKIGKYLTLASFALFAVMLWREWRVKRD
jgi:hypothetical protein